MKTYVWTGPTRLVHWLLALVVLAAFILGDEEPLRHWHAFAGLVAGLLVLFRLIWGFVGPRYSKFSDFAFTPSMAERLQVGSSGEKKIFPGHNLEASWVMVVIYVALLIVVTSGFVTYAGVSTLFGNYGLTEQTAHLAANIHHAALTVLWISIVVHLVGVVLSFTSDRKEGALQSMFTGYKNLDATGAKLSTFQKWFATIALVVFLVFVFFGFRSMNQAEHKAIKTVEIKNEAHE